MKRIIYIFLGILSGIGYSFGQDIHFSAMDYSPLTLNPALAGAKYDLQATVNYRNQWNAVAAPYQTIAASYDMRIGEKSAHEKGYLAAGINFFNDNTGKNKISTNSLALSVAYHLRLNDKSFLGLGLQGQFGNRGFDASEGRWGSQFDGTGHNADISSGEQIDRASFNYFDVGAGLLYSYNFRAADAYNNGTKLQVGFSSYHINKPKYSFIKDENDRLYMRFAGSVLAEIGFSGKRMALEPQFIVQFQGPSIETLLGTDYRYFLGEGIEQEGQHKGISLAAGLFYRNNDALISRLSIRYENIDFGAIYDFNIFSDLKKTSKAKGGFEIFLRYALNHPFKK